MESKQVDIQASLQELRGLTATDFAALALTEYDKSLLRWRFASGNRNDRYKRIELPPGKGIEGRVIRSGRTFTIESFTPQSGDDPRDYSILLAEGLKAIICAPVTFNHHSKGVLLVGWRKSHQIQKDLVMLVNHVAEQFGTFFSNKNTPNPSSN